MEKRKDIPWVTLAKFLGLYLMILGHMELVEPEHSAFIYTFHMPLFFILSGMFAKRVEDKKTFAKKLWKRLLIPFMIIAATWCVIYIVLWVKNGIFDISYWLSYIIGTFISPGKDFLTFQTLRGPLWFLLALAEIKLLNFCCKQKLHWVVAAAISVMLFILLKKINIVLPIALDSAMMAMPFYCVGMFLKEYLLKENSDFTNIILLSVFSIITLFIYRQNGIVDINHCLYGDSLILFYLGGISGSLMIIFLTKLHLLNFIKSGGVIVTITAGAMLIIGYSQTISSMIRTLLPFLAGTTWGGMVIGLLTMAVSYPLILLAMRYFPAILGYRK